MAINVYDISTYGYVGPIESLKVASYGYLSGTSITEVIDYCENAKARLLEQFKRSEDLQGFLCALLSGVQELDAVFQDMQLNRALDNAVGAQLQGIADIVGANISGMDTLEARTEIRLQIAINVSNGEPESVIAFLKEITNATWIQYREEYPAAVLLFTNGPTIPVDLMQFLESIVPAGVRIELTTSYGDLLPFAFAPEGGPDPDGLGFNEPNDPLSGGVLVEKL